MYCCNQVNEVQPRFVQRRHSLTSNPFPSICNPTEDKKSKTPWKMVKYFCKENQMRSPDLEFRPKN